MEKQVINGLWIGGPLTNIQKLSIQSFLDNGHDYILWTYKWLNGIPKGAICKDFEEIVPWKDRERFRNDANFSDWFRTNLLIQRGGWYADTDIVCLKPFDFVSNYVFVSEYQFGDGPPKDTTPLVNGCIARIPAGDRMLAAIKERIEQMDTRNCGWCDVGPNQFRWGVKQFNLSSCVQHPDIFDSLWPCDLNKFVGPSDSGINSVARWTPADSAYAIHLRTSYWKAGSALDPNKTYPAESWFEYLKRRHRVGH